MKKIVFSAILAALLVFARADVDLTRDEVSKIKNLDADSVGEKAAELQGQIVRMKFNYRTQQVTHNADGTYTGGLNIYRYGSRTGGKRYISGHVGVVFPASAKAWFDKLPTDDLTHQSFSAIVRVTKYDPDTVVEILGREIKTDVKGSHIVW
jgi:hypothetical protein